MQTGPFGSQLHASDYVQDGIPVVMPSDIKANKITTGDIARIAQFTADTLRQHILISGDIVFARRGDIGRCALVTAAQSGWICGTGCLRVRLNDSACSSQYLIHYLTWGNTKDWLTKNAVGQTMLNLNTSILARLPITLPSLHEQRTIASILESVNETIEATQAVIEQLQVVKKAMMAELLTRGIPGRHKRFKKTEIGEMPEEWPVARLNEVASVQTGIAKNTKQSGGHLVTVPYIRVANVQDGYVDLSEVKNVQVEQSALNRFALQEGDVLFTEGGDADKLGRGCVWKAQIHPCLHQNHVFAVRTNTAILLPEFLALYAAGPEGRKYFLGCAKQTTNLASINSSQLKALPLPLVPLDEQKAIVANLMSFSDRILAEEAGMAALVQLKSALMSVLLTGEVRVPLDGGPAGGASHAR